MSSTSEAMLNLEYHESFFFSLVTLIYNILLVTGDFSGEMTKLTSVWWKLTSVWWSCYVH